MSVPTLKRAGIYFTATILVSALIAAVVTLQTGDMAKYALAAVNSAKRSLINMYEEFVDLTTVLFAILAGAYVVELAWRMAPEHYCRVNSGAMIFWRACGLLQSEHAVM